VLAVLQKVQDAITKHKVPKQEYAEVNNWFLVVIYRQTKRIVMEHQKELASQNVAIGVIIPISSESFALVLVENVRSCKQNQQPHNAQHKIFTNGETTEHATKPVALV